MPWGGTYKVTAEIGFNAGFTLDDTDGYGTLDDPLCTIYASGVGVDITEDVQEIRIERGRSDQLQEFSASTCSITLGDYSRKYDPENTASPYYNSVSGTSGVTIRRVVKVFYDATQIFTGRITDIDISFEPSSLPTDKATVILECADDFVVLANTRIEEFTPSAQLGGARITALLALPEVAYAATTNLDAGTITLTAEPIADQTVLLDYLQQIAKTEQGYLFMSGDGELRFSNRLQTLVVSDPFFFADDNSGDADYETLSVLYGQEALFNRVVCTPIDSLNPGIADDATSQSEYGVSALHLDSLLCSEADAQDLADYMVNLFKEPQYRFDSVSCSFGGNKISTAVQQSIIDLDLGSVLKVKKSFATGTPLSITQNLSVEGISHTITPVSHNILFKTAVRSIADPFTLDSATLGQLDSTNAVS